MRQSALLAVIRDVATPIPPRDETSGVFANLQMTSGDRVAGFVQLVFDANLTYPEIAHFTVTISAVRVPLATEFMEISEEVTSNAETNVSEVVAHTTRLQEVSVSLFL